MLKEMIQGYGTVFSKQISEYAYLSIIVTELANAAYPEIIEEVKLKLDNWDWEQKISVDIWSDLICHSLESKEELKNGNKYHFYSSVIATKQLSKDRLNEIYKDVDVKIKNFNTWSILHFN